jgi:oxygen-independent coproporphyrinogen-3 oxidase
LTLPVVPSRAEPATSGTLGRETEVGSVFVSNYPPYSAWSAAQVPRFFEALSRSPAPGSTLGLYLHIPFCRKRCKFCYFRVYTDKDNRQITSYLDAVAKEARLLAATPAIAGRPLEFVYFGGGTPSYLSVKQLEKLFGDVDAALPFGGAHPAREVTFEAEPGTLQRSKLEALRALGVTRLSLGIENFDDDILRENGRAHTSEEIWRVLPWIHELGFPQLNIDLISGMVGERWETWRETVRRTVEVAPESVTVYQMELPYNTVYSHELQEGEPLRLASWDEKRAWHDYAFAELAKAGYHPSSAYTMVRDGGEASSSFVYRDLVWEGTDLAALGVASFGHLQGVHYQNVASWGEYLEILEQESRLPVSRAFATTADERLTRELILQLKRGRVALAPFRRKFGVDPAERFAAPLAALAADGMLRVEDDAIAVTHQGLLRVDALLPPFYAAEYRGARYT